MPKEKFFPDVRFHLPKPILPPIMIPSRRIRIDSGEPVHVVDHLPPAPIEEDHLAEYVPTMDWRADEIRLEFRNGLSALASEFNIDLPTSSYRVVFVGSKNMLPKDKEPRERLARRYGAYILDGISGSCTRLPNGRFRLRLGYMGKQKVVDKDSVMETLSHEYGHTLGDLIDNPIFEELKADAFCSLFMRVYTDVNEYLIDGESPDKVHDIARSRLAQLTLRGFSEGAIIAHLTGKSFGDFRPDSNMRIASETRTA